MKKNIARNRINNICRLRCLDTKHVARVSDFPKCNSLGGFTLTFMKSPSNRYLLVGSTSRALLISISAFSSSLILRYA